MRRSVVSLDDTVELRPVSGPGRWRGPFRWLKASTGKSLDRRLRMLAGVNESLLDRVSSERSRYTALGGVVLGTAAIASFSMWMALSEALGAFSFVYLIPALIWGLFVLNFDRWLVSSATGTRWGPRVTLLLGRLALAAFFGIIIAEPLVVRIFQTAIEQHVEDSRSDSLQSLASNYVRCNPPPGSAQDQGSGALMATCAGYLLNLPADTSGISAELAADQSNATSLQQTVATETSQLNQLNAEAAAECSGTAGPGLTGRAGNGPLCVQRRNAATQFAAANPIDQQQSQLSALRTEINGLRQQMAGQQNAFLSARASAINQKVADQRSHQGAIGLLERFQALSELTAMNGFLNAAKWCLSIFFILVDCLPVLGKLLGGITAYDRLVERSLTSAEQIFDFGLRIEEGQALAAMESARYSTDLQVSKAKADADVELRRYEVETNRQLDEQVARAADQILRQMREHRTVSLRV